MKARVLLRGRQAQPLKGTAYTPAPAPAFGPAALPVPQPLSSSPSSCASKYNLKRNRKMVNAFDKKKQ